MVLPRLSDQLCFLLQIDSLRCALTSTECLSLLRGACPTSEAARVERFNLSYLLYIQFNFKFHIVLKDAIPSVHSPSFRNTSQTHWFFGGNRWRKQEMDTRMLVLCGKNREFRFPPK